MEVTGT